MCVLTKITFFKNKIYHRHRCFKRVLNLTNQGMKALVKKKYIFVLFCSLIITHNYRHLLKTNIHFQIYKAVNVSTFNIGTISNIKLKIFIKINKI